MKATTFFNGLALSAVLAVVPLAYSSEQGIVTAKACADGSCCPQSGSICGLNGQTYFGYYYQSSGPCGGGGDEKEPLHPTP